MTSKRYYAEDTSEIDIFREKYDFLSNFFPVRFIYDGIEFYNVEAAYQAAKCANPEDKPKFKNMLGNQAKKFGKQIATCKDWEEVKVNIMREILVAKFTQNPILAKYLVETGEKSLMHGNNHNDLFWGVDYKTKKGENQLGKLLMELRKEFKEQGIPNNDTLRPINLFGPVCNMILTDEDITQMDVECIVNAANSTLLGGGGVDGAIHRAAGPELLKECRGLNGCKTGEAKITKGYRLKAKYVIHTVGPIYGKDDPTLLAMCYKNSLDLAKKNDIHSIAFPAISTGVYRYPKDKAADVAIATVKSWIDKHSDYQIMVLFSCFDHDNYNIIKERLIALSEQ